jgi:L-alanine-DL-glutamate epimerase-like enolase superfamily enzyme
MIKQRVPDGFLWGDANGGYTFAEALKIIPSLEDAGLDLLEQPLPSTQMRDWHALKRTMRIPLAVDEPIVSPRDLMEWIRQDLISALATKVFPGRRVVSLADLRGNCGTRAADDGFSGLTETGLGLAANLQLACAFGIQTPCTWIGPQFLADNIVATPLRIQGGVVHLPDAPGLGVEVDEQKLAFYASPVSID